MRIGHQKENIPAGLLSTWLHNCSRKTGLGRILRPGVAGCVPLLLRQSNRVPNTSWGTQGRMPTGILSVCQGLMSPQSPLFLQMGRDHPIQHRIGVNSANRTVSAFSYESGSPENRGFPELTTVNPCRLGGAFQPNCYQSALRTRPLSNGIRSTDNYGRACCVLCCASLYPDRFYHSPGPRHWSLSSHSCPTGPKSGFKDKIC